MAKNTTDVPTWDDKINNCVPVDFGDVIGGTHHYIKYWLNRTQSMFEYAGLPETIPQRNLEKILQTSGYAVWHKVNGDLYVFSCGLGGERNVYYEPTKAIITSPALDYSNDVTIGTECVLMRNDSCMEGLLPLFTRYATMMADNECTIRMADINTRIAFILTAPDDPTKKACEEFLKGIERGKLGAVGDNTFLDGIKLQPGAHMTGNALTQLIELEQYLKASCLVDIGLSANYNMKREALNSAESSSNDDALLPLVQDMLNQRKIALEQINAMYDTNITVDLAGAWKYRAEEAEQQAEQTEETEQPEEVNNDEQTD